MGDPRELGVAFGCGFVCFADCQFGGKQETVQGLLSSSLIAMAALVVVRRV